MIEFLSEVLLRFVLILWNGCFELGWLVYELFVSKEINKKNLPLWVEVLVGIIGTILIALILLLILWTIMFLR